MKKTSNRYTKKEFVPILQKHLNKMFDIQVSLNTAYDIFKLCQLLPYHLATKKDATIALAGIGKYRTYIIAKSGNEQPKFYGSETVQRILTAKKDLIDYIKNPQVYRKLTEDEVEVAEAPKKTTKAKEAPKKVAKKSKPTKPEVEEVEEIDEFDEVEVAEAPKKTTKKSTVPKKQEVEKEMVEEAEDDDFSLDEFEL